MPDIRLSLTTDAAGAIKNIKLVEAGLESVDKTAKKTQATVDETGKKVRDAFGQLTVYAEKLMGLNTPALAAAAGLGALTGASVALSKAIGAATKEAIAYGGKLADMAAKTGIAASSLQKLEHAGRLTGASTDQLSGAVTKMQKALVEGGKGIDALGLSQQRLLAMKPEAAFGEIAKAIKSIEDPAQQAAAAMQVFGKSGAEMLPTLKSSLEDAALQAEHLGLVLSDDTVAALDAVGDSVDTMGAAWDAAWRNVGATIAKQPEFIAAVNGLTEALGALARGAPAATQALVNYFAAIDRFMLGGNLQQLLGLVGAMGRLSGAAPAVKTPMFGPMEAPAGPKLPSSAAAIELATKNVREFEKAAEKARREAEKLAAAMSIYQWNPNNYALPEGGITRTRFENVLQTIPELRGGRGVGASMLGAQAGAATGGAYTEAFKRAVSGLPAVILAAIQGGGNVGRSIGAHLGGSIGESLAAPLTKSLGSVLGKTLGGALGALAPGLGSLIGAGIGGLIGKIFGGGPSKAEIEKQKKDLLSQFDDLLKKIEAMQREFAQKGGSAWSDYIGRALEATDISEERLQRLARMGVASFAALRKAGFGWLESIRIMNDGLLALQKRASEMGVDLGAAFKKLSAAAEWAEAHADAIQMAEDLSGWIDALRAMGMVTADVLKDLAAEMHDLFKQLGGDIDDLTTEASQRALAILAPTLFKLRKEAERLGIVLDADTQKLIDAAEKGGLFEGLQDPIEQLNELFGLMVLLLAELARYWGVVLPDAVQRYLDKANGAPRPPEVPSGPGGPPPGETPPTTRDPILNMRQVGGFFASGAVNAFFPPKHGGHWLNVAEGGRGEYVTVTHGPVAMLSKHGLISSSRVPRGVTHAEDEFFGALGFGGAAAAGAIGGGASVAGLFGGSGASGVGDAAALEVLARAVSAQRPVSVNVSFSPTVSIRDESVIKTREGVEAFDNFLLPRVDQALRLNRAGLETRVREIVRSELRRVG